MSKQRYDLTVYAPSQVPRKIPLDKLVPLLIIQRRCFNIASRDLSLLRCNNSSLFSLSSKPLTRQKVKPRIFDFGFFFFNEEITRNNSAVRFSAWILKKRVTWSFAVSLFTFFFFRSSSLLNSFYKNAFLFFFFLFARFIVFSERKHGTFFIHEDRGRWRERPG